MFPCHAEELAVLSCHHIFERDGRDQSHHSSDLKLNVSEVIKEFSLPSTLYCSVTHFCMMCSHLPSYNWGKAAEPLPTSSYSVTHNPP